MGVEGSGGVVSKTVLTYYLSSNCPSIVGKGRLIYFRTAIRREESSFTVRKTVYLKKQKIIVVVL